MIDMEDRLLLMMGWMVLLIMERASYEIGERSMKFLHCCQRLMGK
jgi:hypothetical protein